MSSVEILPPPVGDQADDTLDRLFKALGDRTRRALLARLSAGPERVTELAKQFDMSLPAVGKHIRVLEKAGLLNRTVVGRVHECALQADALETAEAWIARYRRFWNETLDSLVAHLEQEEAATTTAEQDNGTGNL